MNKAAYKKVNGSGKGYQMDLHDRKYIKVTPEEAKFDKRFLTRKNRREEKAEIQNIQRGKREDVPIVSDDSSHGNFVLELAELTADIISEVLSPLE